MVGDTEQDIIMKLRDPKMCNAGFEQLVLMYRESLYWHIRRLVVSNEDAEDILQESLIKAYRSLDELRQMKVCNFYAVRSYLLHRMKRSVIC